MKKIIFILVSIILGIALSFFIAELGYRFYLFGFRLHYEDNRIIDAARFRQDKKYIFFTGDSFTQGYPFPIDQSYPMRFEKMLKREKIKIVNFSMVASELYDQVNIIRQISELNPSLIVWGLSTNDICTYINDNRDLAKLTEYGLKSFPTKLIKRNYFKKAFIDLPYDCLVNTKMSIFSTIKEILNNYSYVYIVLKNYFLDKDLFVFLRTKRNADYRLNEIRPDLLKYYRNGVYPGQATKAISFVNDFLISKKIKLILLYVPQETDLNENFFELNILQAHVNKNDYNRKNMRKHISDFCHGKNILFIDPSDYMEGLLAKKKLFMVFDRHYNYYGNLSMAKFLSENPFFLYAVNNL